MRLPPGIMSQTIPIRHMFTLKALDHEVGIDDQPEECIIWSGEGLFGLQANGAYCTVELYGEYSDCTQDAPDPIGRHLSRVVCFCSKGNTGFPNFCGNSRTGETSDRDGCTSFFFFRCRVFI